MCYEVIYFLVALHFTETSFYWHDFVLQIWVHHFTTQLLKIPAVSIILQVHFCYTETNRNQQFFHTKPAADRMCAFRWETDTAVLPPLFYWIRARNYSVYTLGWWVAEITPTHTMSVQSTDQTTPSTTCGFLVLWKKITPQSGVILLANMKKIASSDKISFILLVEFGRKHSSASFYRFNFGS